MATCTEVMDDGVGPGPTECGRCGDRRLALVIPQELHIVVVPDLWTVGQTHFTPRDHACKIHKTVHCFNMRSGDFPTSQYSQSLKVIVG